MLTRGVAGPDRLDRVHSDAVRELDDPAHDDVRLDALPNVVRVREDAPVRDAVRPGGTA